ncbi:MAG: lamin tail domain-containing protein [Phycisphaerales bacterium JB037]
MPTHLAPILLGALLAPPPAPPPARHAARHPVITEVLYAVPRTNGDANLDGRRQPTGDEFVELFNPHDTPINLRGYTLTDRNPADMGRFRFAFPDLELQPGQFAVVFNGLESKWTGPVGDTRRAPPAPHPWFAGAWVFTLANDSDTTGFGNEGDWVLLSAPDGSPVSCILWGSPPEQPPAREPILERAPEARSASIERDPETGTLRIHAFTDEKSYSPGRWAGAESPPNPAPPDSPSGSPDAGPPRR